MDGVTDLVFALCACNSECFFLFVHKCLKLKQLSKVRYYQAY